MEFFYLFKTSILKKYYKNKFKYIMVWYWFYVFNYPMELDTIDKERTVWC